MAARTRPSAAADKPSAAAAFRDVE